MGESNGAGCQPANSTWLSPARNRSLNSSSIGYYTGSFQNIFDHGFRELLPPDKIKTEEVKKDASPAQAGSSKPSLVDFMKQLREASQEPDDFEGSDSGDEETGDSVEIPDLGQDFGRPAQEDYHHGGEPVGFPEYKQEDEDCEDAT